MKIFLIFLVACSSPSINLTKHYFGKFPSKIIWFQIAGLSEEHLALVHFEQDQKTILEDSTCFGKSWHYTLYDIRPSVEVSSLVQILGTRDIKTNNINSTDIPFWESFVKSGYAVSIFETGDFASLSKYEDQLLKNVTLNRNSSKDISLVEQITASIPTADRFIYLIRDFSYYNALISKKGDQAVNILKELLTAYNRLNSNPKNTLVLVSGVSALNLDLPQKGNWKNIKISFKPSLLSPVWARGAGAENFCGIYNDYDLTTRFLR